MQEAFDRIREVNPKAALIRVFFQSSEFSVLMDHQGVPNRVLIGRFTVPSKVNWILPNPLPMIIKLVDVVGTQIPYDSKLVLTKKAPLDDKPTEIAQIQYISYFGLTEAEQRNACFYHTIQVQLLPLLSKTIQFQEREVLGVDYVEPKVAIDLTQRGTCFEFPIGVINHQRLRGKA
jgi:hypothetical protein